jgi:hypothetical protein
MTRKWWQKLVNPSSAPGGRTRAKASAPRRGASPLALEALEDRTLLDASALAALTPAILGNLGPAAAQQAALAASQTNWVGTPTPSVFAQSVTLAVNVTGQGSGKPTGTVTFRDGSNILGGGPVSLDASGRATLSVSTLGVGNNNIVATYNGDSNFAPSTSAVWSQMVDPAHSTITLTDSAATTSTGQPVTFTATVAGVTPGAGEPTGTVAFKENGNSLGNGNLDAHGHATFTTSSLAVGSHSIIAVYNGDAHFAVSTSQPVTEQIIAGNLAPSNTTLTSSAPTTHAGQPVTLTVNVTGQGSGKPTGTVTFKDNGAPLGAPVALDATGKAVFSATFQSPGSHSLTAVYSGDAHFASSTSAVLTEQVNGANLAPSTTTLGSSAATALVGQPVTFTAVVAGQGSNKPTGAVTFKDGATVLKTMALDATGHAVYTTSGLAVGGHSITAVYSGDSHFAPSTSTVLAEHINGTSLAPTTTGLTSSAATALAGQPVTFTAVVAGQGSSKPTGQVTFKDGNTVLKTMALDATGKAVYATSALTVGGHAITAVYSGDAHFAPSTSTVLAEQIHGSNQAASTTTLSSSAATALVGHPVTFTAMVAGQGSIKPTGTVTFKDGATVLKTMALDVTGHAVYTTSALAVGGHSITAVYSGDSHFAPSTSTVLAEHINGTSLAPTTTALTSSAATALVGQPVTFTAVVAAQGLSKPTGTVTFKDGNTVLKTMALDATGKAIYVTSGLAVGGHTITASYSGDVHFASSASHPLAEQIHGTNQTPSTTTLTSSAATAVSGEGVTFTAIVAAHGGTKPTGEVTFKDGSTVLKTVALDASGKAIYATAFAGPGTHNITAVYSGDTHFATSASQPLAEHITKAGTKVVLASNAQIAGVGLKVTFTITVTVPAPGAGKPTGQVVLKDGSHLLATLTLDASGHATFSTTTLSAGNHTITANYGGDADFLPNSATLNEQVVIPLASGT